MSDYDRGKRRKKRSGYGGGSSKDRESHDTEFGLSGTMVILAKPHNPEQTQSQPTNAALSDPGIDAKIATTLSKNQPKHDSSSASSTTTAPVQSRSTHNSGNTDATSNKGVTPIYQLQQKQSSQNESNNATLEQKLSPPPDMLAPVKLIDEALQWCDNAMEFLLDQNDFYVVGVLGLQGSGKSTVLSLISGNNGHGRQVFKAQTDELAELGAHCTNGVDIYITSERVILLDTQPVLSASVMDRIIQYEKKSLSGPEYTSTENALQMQSLQITAFLMAVCHTIVVVQDWFTDPNLLRFIQAAEMLKPATPNNLHEMTSSVDDILEYYPHLVFVQNKCTQFDYSPENIAEMDRTLNVIFCKSRLKFQGFVGMQECKRKSDQLKERVNLFLLPDRNSDTDWSSGAMPEHKGHPGLKELAQSLMHQVLAMPPNLLTRTTLSEKNWFHYAARIWEAVKKSNLFLEYNRLLP